MSNEAFTQNFNPDWLPADSLKSYIDDQIISLIAGRYKSIYIMSGWSSPEPLNHYKIIIYKDGKLEVLLQNDLDKPSDNLILELNLKISNNNGYISIEPVLKKNSEVLSRLNFDYFSGILYISKDHKQVMFGNEIESDAGPATVWERVNTQ